MQITSSWCLQHCFTCVHWGFDCVLNIIVKLENFLFAHSVNICQTNILMKWPIICMQKQTFLLKPKQTSNKSTKAIALYPLKMLMKLPQKRVTNKMTSCLTSASSSTWHILVTCEYVLSCNFDLKTMWKYFCDHHTKCISSWRHYSEFNICWGCIEFVIEPNHDDFVDINWIRFIFN